MIKWLHHLLNPHCPECRLEAKEKREEELESKLCQSCESLKAQIETLRYDNKQLLAALIQKETSQTEPVTDTSELKPILPRMVPWSQRRQMLEAEDRQTAALLRNREKAAVPADKSTDDLEKELDVAEREREAQAK